MLAAAVAAAAIPPAASYYSPAKLSWYGGVIRELDFLF
jgi:hypothetical protein